MQNNKSKKKEEKNQGVEKKENKQQPGKNRYGEDTQHVEKFIWHLKMIIGYKLIATMLTLSSPLADLRMELELGRGAERSTVSIYIDSRQL